MALFVKSVLTVNVEVLCKVQCSVQIQRVLVCFHFCCLSASCLSALSCGGAIFLCRQHKAGGMNELSPLQPLAQCPPFLHKRLWLIALLFSDQKCQKVSVKSRISWAELLFGQRRACRFAVVKCSVPKVMEMANGKAISNKLSVFFFSRPLASL